MNNTLSEILNEILAFLNSWNLPTSKYLKEGLSHDKIIELLNNIRITPPSELIELYSWRNGTNVEKGTPLDDVQFIPGFYILSLDHAILDYVTLTTNSFWNLNWFPFMANGGGDFYAVDLSTHPDDSAPVIGFILGEAQQDIEYQSIMAMMQTFLDCCQNNIIFCTEDGYLEMDDDRQAVVARKYNPNVDFWQV